METEKKKVLGPVREMDMFRNRVLFARIAVVATVSGSLRFLIAKEVTAEIMVAAIVAVLTSIVAHGALRLARESGKVAADTAVRNLAERPLLTLLFVPLFILRWRDLNA